MTDQPGAPRRLHPPPLGVVLLVLVAYIPLLLTRPGKVGADTKTYLYLDPGRLLSRATNMWDPNIGLGTVTHQNIGYLWPMGPYYWLMDAIGLPDWVTQRLWLGSIILAAGLGMRWMLKELRWEGAGVTVASFAYALSPYLLDYAARISVILLPFAGLPWLIGLASRSVRVGGWRAPAVFALVTLTVGGVNATSLALVMVGPILWLFHVTFVAKEVTLKQTLAAGLRITVLTLATSFWWIAGLLTQGRFGIPILRYTETYVVVANAAVAPEILRGLGYWFFYGRDGLGPWIQPAVTMVQNIPALALSYFLPILAFTGALLTRFRHRGFFALLTVIGLLLAVGSHPWDASSPAGAVFKAWTRSDSGMAFRSTPRAVPLIALSLAVFLGAGVAALSRWRPRLHMPIAGSLLVLICLNQSALFLGQMVDRNLLRDEDIPGYWNEVAAHLDAGDRATRAYEMPGSDFASYRWGATVDPVTPGLTDRDYTARELIPYGTPPSSNMLNEWDVPLQEGHFDPTTVAPIARLLGIGDIVHRADLQYERYRTPRPRVLQQQLTDAPGLGAPTTFGEVAPNTPTASLPLDDEAEFATPNSYPDTAPVSVFPVEDPRPMIRGVQASSPVVLSGDAAGIVGLASAGRLQVDRPLFESASFADDEEALRSIVDEPDSELVVSDTNRRAARRWGAVRENDGYTERAGEVPEVKDPADNRLDVFPGAGDDTRSVTLQQPSDVTVGASSYGNPVSYTAGDRAAFAFDGDPTTAWKVGAFDDVMGEYLTMSSDAPVTTDHITVLQTQKPANRWITELTLGFDCPESGGECAHEEVVPLTDASRSAPGQELRFPERTFNDLRLTVTDTNLGQLARYKAISDVGFAEVTIPGIDTVSEVIRPPVDLLDAVGAASVDKPLTYLFQRRRASPTDVLVADSEPRLLRQVDSPAARQATTYGKARMSARLRDDVVDRLVGLPDVSQGALTAVSQSYLPGDLRSRAAGAVDGDPSTAWQTPINASVGNWIEVTYPDDVSFSELPITIVADGRHSVPTAMSMQVDGGAAVPLDLGSPSKGDGRERGATETINVPTGDVTGRTFRFTIDAIDERGSIDWFGGGPTVTPVGIAELGLPVTRAPLPEGTAFPATCRDDLARLGDVPIPLRVVGTVDDALAGNLLRLESCGGPTEVPRGSTLLSTSLGRDVGLDVDLLALSSAAGGGPGIDSLAVPLGDGPTPPEVATTRPGRLAYDSEVTGATQPYWMVLGQSLSGGWHASVNGKDLGPATLINGFANGWRIDPAEVGADATIEFRWTPQTLVWIAIWASVIGVLLCVGLAIRPVRWLARSRPAAEDPSVADAPPAMVPTIVFPDASDGPPLRPGRAGAVALAVGLVTWIAMGPWVALAVTAVTAVALAVRRGQVVLRVVCVGALALSAAFIVGKQLRYGYVVDFDWMNKFEITHAWGLAAAALLAIDPLVELLRRRRNEG